jgi:4,5:9,10-diseco-3-hydroxy-5,9,17-trioxoandrosta-1(10),2-diene-4-oate hydrolase
VTDTKLDTSSQHILIEGVNVHYIQAGEGPVVLLLHGLGTSLVTWCRNIVPLATAGFQVLALDLPGYGDSDKPKHLSYDPVAGATLIHRFLATLGVERASLVGNSAGGLIVSLFALSYPEKVERLVLVSSGGLGRQMSWFLRLLSLPIVGDLFYQPHLQAPYDITRRVFYQPPLFLPEVLPEMQRTLSLPGFRHAGLKSIRSSINLFGLRQHRYILPQLKQLPAPLMIVWGEEDKILPVSHARLAQQALPDSVVHIIPQCGHWPHMEKDTEFNALLTRFLSDAEFKSR